MKKKYLYIICIVIIFLILITIFFFLRNKTENEKTEYIPQEEISEEQERMTIVSLYYLDEQAETLKKEDRLIDVKSLVNNPYETLFNLLKEKPNSKELKSAIPEGTEFKSAEIKNGILYLNLSKEFIENHKGGKNEELQTIYSIVNTLTELVEVNSVKILIDGQENLSFKDEGINFTEAFLKI